MNTGRKGRGNLILDPSPFVRRGSERGPSNHQSGDAFLSRFHPFSFEIITCEANILLKVNQIHHPHPKRFPHAIFLIELCDG